MAKFLYTQYSFSSGKLNPRLLGRTDIKEYFNSCKELDNFLVTQEGSANELAGTRALAYLNQADGAVAEMLYPSKIVFNRNPLRVSPSAVNNREVFYTIHVREDAPNNVNYSDIFEVLLMGTTKESLVAKGLVAGDTTLPFVVGTYLQLNDTMIITDKNGNYEPVVIFPNGDGATDFAIGSYSYFCNFINGGSLDEDRYASMFYTAPENTTTNVLNISGASITASEPVFNADMVGSYIEVDNSGTSHKYKIDSYSNTFQVSVSAVGAAAPNGNYSIFRLPEWYPGNYPKVVGFFEQRLLFANIATRESEVWASKIGDITIFTEAFNVALDDDSPFSFIPFSVDTSPIYWLLTERYLTVGTATEEFIVTKVDGIFSGFSNSLNITSTSKYGSHDVGLAFRAQSSSYFIERGGVTLRELSFSEENGGYVSKNIGTIGPDIEPVVRVVYNYADKRVFLTTKENSFADPKIKCVTLDGSAGVLAWSEILYSGEAIGFDGENETVIMTDRYSGTLVEYKNTTFYRRFSNNTAEEGFLPYSSLIGDEKYVGVLDNLGPTEYRMRLPSPDLYDETTVGYVNTNGTVVAEATVVDAGSYKYVESTSNIAYIYKPRRYDSLLETTPTQQGSAIGDAQLSFQRVDKLGLRMYRALGNVEVGTTETSLETTEYTTEFTGVHEVHVDGCPEIDHTIIVKNTSDRPVSILGISARGRGEEG